MADYFAQEGDLEPPLTLYLADRDGNIPDFRNGDNSLKTVKFYGWQRGDDTYTWLDGVDGAVGVEAEGQVILEWPTGKTDTPGIYYVVVKLIDNSVPARAETFPAEGSATVQIGGLPA